MSEHWTMFGGTWITPVTVQQDTQETNVKPTSMNVILILVIPMELVQTKLIPTVPWVS